MIVQYIIVGIVVLGALSYAYYRIRKALSVKSGDPCYGCALKKVCKRRSGSGLLTRHPLEDSPVEFLIGFEDLQHFPCREDLAELQMVFLL